MASEQDAIVCRAVKNLICPTEGFIRVATNADAESIFHFINKAYFTSHSKYRRKGFENRLDRVEDLYNFVEKGMFLLLTASSHEQLATLNDECSIVACVFIHHMGIDELTKPTVDIKLSVNINFLAVHPTMLKRGIGRYMIQVVEAVAKTCGYTHVFLTVLSLHQHLLDLYAKWGFNVIGTKTLTDCGSHPEKYISPCHFIVMEKDLL
jgi:N-acetylglutamate synthase-like GNAT family acetyltransferase